MKKCKECGLFFNNQYIEKDICRWCKRNKPKVEIKKIKKKEVKEDGN